MKNLFISMLFSLLLTTSVCSIIYAYSTKQELKKVELQRDLLSDAIRSYDDQDDKEDISIMETTQYFLETEGYCIHDLSNWVYCY